MPISSNVFSYKYDKYTRKLYILTLYLKFFYILTSVHQFISFENSLSFGGIERNFTKKSKEVMRYRLLNPKTDQSAKVIHWSSDRWPESVFHQERVHWTLFGFENATPQTCKEHSMTELLKCWSCVFHIIKMGESGQNSIFDFGRVGLSPKRVVKCYQ